MFASSDFYCVVAEQNGRLIGSNCLDLRSVIAGLGPITIDPAVQNSGIGRSLMQAAMDRCRRTPRFRHSPRAGSLPQPLALALHAPRFRCPRAALLHAGPHHHALPPRLHCAPRNPPQTSPPATLSLIVSTDSIAASNSPRPSTTRPPSSSSGTAASPAMPARSLSSDTPPPKPTLTSRHSSPQPKPSAAPASSCPHATARVFRWCLANGLRVTQPMTLMSTGLYNEPAGAWFPSVLF